jgi:gamma-glutamylcyclotransferase (GGCT)/AIG2-like uncharacterized protein YtfP
MCQYLFVYGTLQPDCAPDEIAHAAAQLRFVGEASVAAELYDLGQFPGAVLSDDSSRRVPGKLFELPDDESVLRAIDEYEEFFAEDPARCLFARVRCEAQMNSGGVVSCWAYVYVRDLSGARRIEDGVWHDPVR